MKILKSSISKLFLLLLILSAANSANAQNSKPKLGIVKIESRGWTDLQPFTQIVRIELGKLNLFEVLDRYDIEDVMRKNNINIEECLNKDCILQAGGKLGADLMLSGSIEKLNDKVLIMFRELDTKSGNTLKSITKDFPASASEIDVLIEVTLKEMYGIKIDDVNKQNLDNKNAIANAVNTSNEISVSIGGPRFGLAFFTGDAAEFITRPTSEFGLGGGYPAMFQFGYQFEKMYLSDGDFQAVFEFLPTITGVDQGRFIPSFTFLNGFRSARSGWEFAFGPTITWVRAEESYKDLSGIWRSEKEYNGSKYDSLSQKYKYTPIPFEVVTRSDTRGDIIARSGILIAAGKTFKSGKLNMPLNFYIIPRKTSVQFGVSYGFNAMRTRSVN